MCVFLVLAGESTKTLVAKQEGNVKRKSGTPEILVFSTAKQQHGVSREQ